MFYPTLRNILFQIDPEIAHDWTLKFLQKTFNSPLGKLGNIILGSYPVLPRMVMGISFPNPVGLAAGLDKNGECISAWQALGFGFVEIGTVTPHPQPGNPKPRVFRLPIAQALINRMGFNNKGVDYLIEQVKNSRYKGILGINIGKDLSTPVEQAADDYLICLRKTYPWADYITVNISSPNSPGLRSLQHGTALDQLLEKLKTEQQHLCTEYNRYVPLAVKIDPDLEDTELVKVGNALLRHEIDAVIATNTTFSRTEVNHIPRSEESGGLSGTPLRDLSTEVVRKLAATLDGKLPIIAVGGILKGPDAAAKIVAGASLVQLYTGLIYRGPELIYEAVAALKNVTSS